MTPYEQAMEQARALNPALNNPLSGPGLDKGGMKEFLLRALQLGPMAIGAMPKGGPITGGKSFQILNEMSPTVVNNPGSATDLAMRGNLKTDLGVPQVSGAGIAENTNTIGPTARELSASDWQPGLKQPFSVEPSRYIGDLAPNGNKADPRIKDILSFLDTNKTPANKVYDSQGGTTYIKAKDPLNKSDVEIRIPTDTHVGNMINKDRMGDYFDLGTKRQKGTGTTPFNRNQSREKYGDDPTLGTLKDALNHRLGLGLVPEGRAPAYSMPPKVQKPVNDAGNNNNQFNLDLKPPINPNEAAFGDVKPNLYGQSLEDLHAQIDKHVSDFMPKNANNQARAIASKNMEQPQLTTNEMKDLSAHINDVLRKYEFLRD